MGDDHHGEAAEWEFARPSCPPSWRPPCAFRWPVWQRHRIATATISPHKRQPRPSTTPTPPIRTTSMRQRRSGVRVAAQRTLRGRLGPGDHHPDEWCGDRCRGHRRPGHRCRRHRGRHLRTAAAAGHRGWRRARRGRPGAGPAPIGPAGTDSTSGIVRTAERPAGRRIRLTVVVALLLPLALLGGCGRWREEINGQVAEPVRIRVPIDRSRCAGPAPDRRRERRPACSGHLRRHRLVERRPGAGRTRPRRDRRTPRLLPRARGLLPPQGPQRGRHDLRGPGRRHGSRVRHRADRAARQGRLPDRSRLRRHPGLPATPRSPAGASSTSDTARYLDNVIVYAVRVG